jgi:hypothetical protein
LLQETGATSNIFFDGNSAIFTGAADAGRAYVQTIEKDFFTQSFVAEITLNPGGHISFFGMGNAANSSAFSYEPGGPAINLRLHPSSIVSGRTDAASNNGSTFNTVNTFAYIGSAANERLRLTWNASSKKALFEIDTGYTGTFVADATSALIDGSSLGLSDSNTSIFFGGSNGASFDNFLVTTTSSSSSSSVPDAFSTLAMVSLGFLAAVGARRKFSL